MLDKWQILKIYLYLNIKITGSSVRGPIDWDCHNVFQIKY